jgi:hypothetical protein
MYRERQSHIFSLCEISFSFFCSFTKNKNKRREEDERGERKTTSAFSVMHAQEFLVFSLMNLIYIWRKRN